MFDIMMVIAATIFGGVAAYTVMRVGNSFALPTTKVEMTFEEYMRYQNMKRL